MNRIAIIISSVLLLTIVGCKKDHQEAAPINVSIQLGVEESDIWFDVPYEKAEIKLVHKANNSSYQLKSDADGRVNVTSLVPGNYTISVSLEITADEYTKLTGEYRDDDFYLNYSLDKSIYANENIQITLITTKPVGGFVIKQIYYAGSHVTQGATTRDNFIEIYNNSSETLYADSLIVATIYGKPNKKTDSYSLPNNQFDWSKSLNMNVEGDANQDYVYAKSIVRIPSDGTGKKYPVLPGKSIILAATAVNHAGSYTDLNGKTIGAQDPSLTVDLSKADFEALLHDYIKKVNPSSSPLATDIDNPDVPNLEILFLDQGREWVFTPQTRESYAILKVSPSVDMENLPKYATPDIRTITDNVTLFPQIPAKYILDAVEVEMPVASDRLPRRLPLKLDAGAIFVEGGPFSSQSVVRKTLKTVEGRRILKDTNNSTGDFGFLNRANSSKGNTSFID